MVDNYFINLKLILMMVAIFPFYKNEKITDWSYGIYDANGPMFWHFMPGFKDCGPENHLRSPININTRTVLKDKHGPRLDFRNYGGVVAKRVKIYSDGNTVHVSFEYSSKLDPKSIPQFSRKIDDKKQYWKLNEIRFHWDDRQDPPQGSAHSIQQTYDSMEAEFFHIGFQFRTLEEALMIKHGVAIVSTFFKVDYKLKSNTKLVHLLKYIENIKSPSDKPEEVKLPFNLKGWLPYDDADFISYYWYEGSLMEPPCTPKVLRFLIIKKIPISITQLDIFRSHPINVEDENETMGTPIKNSPMTHELDNGRKVHLTIWRHPV